MKTATFRWLQQLREKYGPGIFGKIAQKLLALAFYDVGFHFIVERGVQGADIDVANEAGDKYSLEVKTTDAESVPISKENIDALEDRARDGFVPLVAALRMQMFEDWVIAAIPRAGLRPGIIRLARLRAYRMRLLEASVCPSFEGVVNQHFAGVLARGESYLIRALEDKRKASSSEQLER